jgi:predicted RNase H-like nuclease (RuvC/YqgF family)
MDTPSVVFYEHSFDDSIIQSLSKNVLNLGNECRALAEENKRLKSLCDNLGMGGKHTITEIEAENARLKAEVERLSKPAIIGGYNISQYIRMANSETLEFDNGDIFANMTLPERIKYIVESHASLKAEVERLRITEQNQTDRVISLEDCIQVLKQDRDGLLYEESEQVKHLKAEVERLTKAGDAMAKLLSCCGNPQSEVRGWNAAKEGKQ